MDSLMDILGNPDVYEAFAVNAVEFDYLLDYLTSKEISPRYIYAEVSLLLVIVILRCR
jgi:E3 ubiquitin-protein ligase CHFR